MSRASFLVALVSHCLMVERLPVRTYTPADGLGGIEVHRIVSDSLGFLWLCTDEGLSRFDGYGFTNYTAEHGLSDTNVYDLLEGENGVYWVATRGGLHRFDTKQAKPRFEVHRPPGNAKSSITRALRSDPSGAIWVGTDTGLFRLEPSRTPPSAEAWAFRVVDLPRPKDPSLPRAVAVSERVFALLRDRCGNLWAGTRNGLYQVRPDGRVKRYSRDQGLPADEVFSLLEDSGGRIWVGTPRGLATVTKSSCRNDNIIDRSYTSRDGLRVVGQFDFSSSATISSTVHA